MKKEEKIEKDLSKYVIFDDNVEMIEKKYFKYLEAPTTLKIFDDDCHYGVDSAS